MVLSGASFETVAENPPGLRTNINAYGVQALQESEATTGEHDLLNPQFSAAWFLDLPFCLPFKRNLCPPRRKLNIGRHSKLRQWS